MKNSIKSIIKEMIPIILGILIALFINNWKESYDDRQYLNKVLESISVEFEENQIDLKESIVEHKMIIDTISYYLEDESVRIGDIIGKMNGIRGVRIKNSSWLTLANSKIELVDHRMLSLLTSINENKHIMNGQLSKLSDLIYKTISSSTYADKELFKIAVNDLLGNEVETLEYHESFLKIIE